MSKTSVSPSQETPDSVVHCPRSRLNWTLAGLARNRSDSRGDRGRKMALPVHSIGEYISHWATAEVTYPNQTEKPEPLEFTKDGRLNRVLPSERLSLTSTRTIP